MKLSLDSDKVNQAKEWLARAAVDSLQPRTGELERRQPVHTVYGGADRFSAETFHKLGSAAVAHFNAFAPKPNSLHEGLGLAVEIAEAIYPRVLSKLHVEPIEDYRIDFEDGYGYRSDSEEDSDAERVAKEVAKAMAAGVASPFLGIRIKSLDNELFPRSVRTFDIFLTSLLDKTSGRLPNNFVITLPKVRSADQVSGFVQLLSHYEMKALLPSGVLRMELMIETPQALYNRQGQCNLPLLLRAADGRCVAAHFGAYDYTAALNVAATEQDLLHPACDFARSIIQNGLAGTGLFLSDGATTAIPKDLDRESLLKVWRLNFRNVRHGLRCGFYQGWDLHPSQIPIRYVALYSFFHESLEPSSIRLRHFVESAARAILHQGDFDDAATGQALLNFFLRGLSCGALTESECEKTGLNLNEIRSRSFLKILNSRRFRIESS